MRVFAPLLLLGLLTFVAQGPPTSSSAGLVSGVVVSQAGTAVAGATVQLMAGPKVERTGRTDSAGAFRFANVPPGRYQVNVLAPGFARLTSAVTVTDGQMVPPLRLALTALTSNAQPVGIPTEAPPPYPAREMSQSADQKSRAAGRAGQVAGGIAPMTMPMPSPTQAFNTEAYARIDENRFRKVGDDPLSTFSVDVDTASYANVRRFLTQGTLPPPDAVRIEELINYFHFGYADPSDGAPFSVTTEVAACPWNPRHRLALIGLQARRLTQERTPPRNLVFLLDVSGSMMPPDKLPLVKTAMSMLVDTLTPADRVAIVVYAGASGLVLPSTPASHKAEIRRAIADLQPGGSTNGAEGIKLAYDIAAEAFIGRGINRVILATDGDFNVGVTSQGELTRLIEAKRERGIFLSVLGVGTGNLKDSTMEQLADKGNGNYAYLDSLHEARRVLIAEAGATLVTVAKDVKIQIEFNPRTVAAYKLIGYENRILQHQDFNDDTKDAGDIGAGHTVTALYEIVPPGEAVDAGRVDPLKYQEAARPNGAAQAGELMTVKLRYKEPDGKTSRLLSRAVPNKVTELTPNLGFAAAVAEFGLLLRQSEHKGSAAWSTAQDLARRYRGEDPDGYRAEMIRLMDLAASLSGGQQREWRSRR